MAASEKIVLMATHGPEDAERATIPFVMGCAALASEVQAVIGFQGNAVNLVRKGEAEHVFAPGFPPLKELLTTFVELGGKLLVCSPCLKSRQISGDSDLVDGAEVVAAARFVAEITSATNALVY